MKTTGMEPSVIQDPMRDYLMNFEQLPFGVATMKNDPHSTLIAANSSFYQMIGYTKAQFQEQHENRMSDLFLDVWYDDVNMEQDWNRTLDLRIRRADGTVVWVHDHTHYDAASNVFFVVFTEMIASEAEVSYKALYHCIESLFTVDTTNQETENAYFDVLNQLRAYYHADEAFFYKFADKEHRVEALYRMLPSGEKICKLDLNLTLSEEYIQFLKTMSDTPVAQQESVLEKFGSEYHDILSRLRIDYQLHGFSCVTLADTQDDMIAFMGVVNPQCNEDDKELMSMASRFVCMFMEHQRDQRLNEEALALENISKEHIVTKCAKNFHSTAHEKGKIEDALDALCDHYDADFAMLLLPNKDSDTYGIPYVGGKVVPDLSTFQNQPSYTMEKWEETFQKHSQFATDADLDAPTSKRILQKQFGIYNFIVAPLYGEDGALTGLLFINNFKFTNRSRVLAYGVATHISDFLKKVHLHEQRQLAPETMIANKATMQNQISQLLEKEASGTLFIIDMDNFKHLNEVMGHSTGDQALIDLGDILQQIFRGTDVIGRVDSDMFVVFSPRLILGDVIENRANQILAKCHHHYNKDGSTVETSVSVGICLVNSRCKIFQSLYENAEYALYVAKKSGKNQYHIYSDAEYSRDTSVANEMRFFPNAVNAIKSAIEEKRFVVHYQPLYHVPTGTFTRAEALVRMRRADGTLIYPNDFIQVAENSGLVVEMTYQILEQVCYDFHQLLVEQPDTTLASIAINLPYLQFTDPNMETRFMEILERYDISPAQIKLEVTERTVVADMDLVMSKMERLVEQGFEFELDDFGTDYSNLKMCVSLPLDIIKLDRSLLLAATETEHDRHFFQHILLAFHESGRHTVMEGVETQEQLDWTTACCCKYIQGYYFSKPVDFENFSDFLQTN